MSKTINDTIALSETGSNITYNPTSQSVNGGRHYVEANPVDMMLREELILRARTPRIESGSVIKQHAIAKIVMKWEDPDTGEIVYNTLEIVAKFDPRIGTAGIDALRARGAGMCLSTQFDAVFEDSYTD